MMWTNGTQARAVHPSADAFALLEMSDETRDDMLAHSSPVQLERGQALPSLAGFLSDGVVGVAGAASDGRPLVCALFHTGDLIDLRRRARRPQGEARALTAVELIAFDVEAIDAVIGAHQDLAALWIEQIRDQFATLRDHCADLSCKTPIERLASALLELRRWPENVVAGAAKAQGRAVTLRLPILRNDLAGYIGVKPETVSRVFRKLEEEKLIEIQRRNVICLKDIAAIRRIANGGRPRAPTR